MQTARIILTGLACCLFATYAAAQAQLTNDPFPAPLEAARDIVAVDFVEFAKIPDAEGGQAPRLMHMAEAPGVQKYFFSTMRGALYSVSRDGKIVQPYIDINDPKWGVPVQFTGNERGLQSFAFHPQFSERGRPGYGKFYTWLDTSKISPTHDFTSGAPSSTHDQVLLEWSAKDAQSAAYDGGAPREIIRTAHPFPNHNGGQIAFNPLAQPGGADFGLLYVGSADGGNGGDPMNLAQNLNSPFGKILRIDPLGANSKNKRYGIPASNPYAADGKDDKLGEIYARGVRNPQRFTWDAKTGRMYVADIGQSAVEEISEVTAGANLGWNIWEASYRYTNRQVDVTGPRAGAGMTWPIAEYDHKDPILLGSNVAVTGVAVYRDRAIPQLADLLIFGDNPSGEIFYIKADAPSQGGPGAIRRILLNDGGKQKTLLQVINDKGKAEGKPAKTRVDLRFGFGGHGEIFVMNKQDGLIRRLVANR
jgi:hypothetical protein